VIRTDVRLTHAEHLREVHRRYVQQLASSARAFLVVGIDNFDWSSEDGDSGLAQAAIANLTIATELLAKAYLAEMELSLVVDSPTLAMRALCACPEKLPAEFRPREHLKMALYDLSKTKHFDDTLQGVYLFLPDIKCELEFALKHFRVYRNTALHSAIPDFDKFRTLLVAWATLRFFEMVPMPGVTVDREYLPPRAQEIVTEFEGVRMARLSANVEAARKVAERLGDDHVLLDGGNPMREVVADCPVCERSAVLTGEAEADFDDDYVDGWGLRPIPVVGIFQSLACPSCGLRLEAPAELRELGVETRLDVTQRLADWAVEHEAETEAVDVEAFDDVEGLL
jgi:hypothetical protein